ncbi:Gfo/Idh/MocA family protein [Bacillus sp. AFS017336]|uniref:Gfo/Idh/MocA family protein n=1 Tax=Bacillus sp. AFS017336 TaxID=2033489 RepID=UPI000BEF74A1|nr:Gfo/Idh/MocA family oxidoreductase [Bacillus sp. AFS017336]PEL12092.1 oxidoreductase [Bacillus sp. AFS017336]
MNLGTIGTSWITESFIEAAKDSKLLNLTAIYSRNEESAKAFALKHNAPNYFTNIEELAKSPEVEIVYIASPNSLHYEQAILLLQNKKHVICEKPIFSTTKELDHAFKVAEENGVYLFEAIRNFHSPNFTALKEGLAKIGQIRSANLHYLQYSSKYDAFLRGENPNVFSPEFSGGALVDLGVYPVYVLIGLFGKPSSVDYTPVKLRTGIDGSGTLVLNYEDFTCSIQCSKVSQSYIESEITGEIGSLVIDKPSPISKITLINHKSKQRESLEVNQVENDMLYEIQDFTRIIKESNQAEYENLKEHSKVVLTVTETARKKGGIVFGVEKN